MSGPCRLDADAAEEPLAATAPERVAAWLLVEHAGPWGRELPQDATAMPEAERAVLTDLQRRVAGLKVIFTRRSGLGGRTTAVAVARPVGPTTAPELPAPWSEWPSRVGWRLDGSVRLHDVLGLLEAGPSSDRAAVLDPLRSDDVCPRWLVCTHGTRDACCARWGRGLLPELERAGEAFRESSHLGGHRFAPVVLDLVSGIMLGRVEEGQLLDDLHRGRQGQVPSLQRWRGRTTLSRFEQAAELHARSTLGLAHDSDIVAVRTDHSSGAGPEAVARVRVELRRGSALTVLARWSEPREVFGSCTDDVRTAFRSVLVEPAAIGDA